MNFDKQLTLKISSWLAIGGLSFQVFHLFEHMLQLAYWVGHPKQPPWMTPWARAGANMLMFDGQLVTGMELLHLVGNLLFLMGIVGMCLVLSCNRSPMDGNPALGTAVKWQMFHVGEHVVLVATWLLFSKQIGYSTFFGMVEAGPILSSYRVWWHFSINLVATIYAVKAMRHILQDHAVRLTPAF